MLKVKVFFFFYKLFVFFKEIIKYGQSRRNNN